VSAIVTIAWDLLIGAAICSAMTVAGFGLLCFIGWRQRAWDRAEAVRELREGRRQRAVVLLADAMDRAQAEDISDDEEAAS
jgi:hypothetical protein